MSPPPAALPDPVLDPAPDHAAAPAPPPARRGLAVAGVVVGALALVTAAVLWLVAGLGDDEAVTPPPAVEPTPGPALLLSADVAPPGAEVLGVLVDETDSGQVFIQLAGVEEWRDGAWVDEGRPLLWCVPDGECAAAVMAPGVMVDFAPTWVEPSSAEPGPLMRMTTEGLEPGWYRISHTSETGVRVSAILEIDEDAPVPPVVSPLE